MNIARHAGPIAVSALAAAGLLFSVSCGDPEARDGEAPPDTLALASASPVLWMQKGHDSHITLTVCIEWADPRTLALFGWRVNDVQAVLSQWESAANIDFTGFAECTPDETNIRVYAYDGEADGRSMAQLGTRIHNVTWGMELNIGAKPGYFEYSVLHEFGHALGFPHEQNRSGAPLDCTNTVDLVDAAAQDQTPADLPLSVFESTSIMSYCGVGNPTALTTTDQAAVKRVYGGVQVNIGTRVGLRAFDGSFLNVSSSGDVRTQPRTQAYEVFELINAKTGDIRPLHYGDIVALRDHRGQYVSAAHKNFSVEEQPEMKSYEIWTVEDTRDRANTAEVNVADPIALRSVHDKYLSASHSDAVQRDLPKEWEVWRLVLAPEAGF